MIASKHLWLLLPLFGALFILGAFHVLWRYEPPEDSVETPSAFTVRGPGHEEEFVSPVRAGGQIEIPLETTGENLSGSIDTSRTAVRPSGIPFSGRVIDRESGDPVTRFDLRIRRWVEYSTWDEVLHETVQHPEGRFSCSLDAGGRYRLQVRSSRYYPFYFRRLEIAAGEEKTGLLIRLHPGSSISGKVKDQETGMPVAGAVVMPLEVQSYFNSDAVIEKLINIEAGFPEYAVHARTDGGGTFLLQGTVSVRQNLMIFHPDYVLEVVDAWPGRKDMIEIGLKRGHRIYGKVFDDDGNALEGALVTVWQSKRWRTKSYNYKTRRNDENYRYQSMPVLPAISGKDGSYRTAPLLPGTVYVSAETTRMEAAVRDRFSRETRRIKVADRDVEVDFGPSDGQASWRGRLLDRRGSSLAGGKVTVRLREPKADIHGVRTTRSAVCDADGRFEIRKLYVGLYSVGLLVPGMSSSIDGGEMIVKRPGVLNEDVRLAGAEARGRVREEHSVKEAGGEEYTISATNRSIKRSRTARGYVNLDGTFRLMGLDPGLYTLEVRGPGGIKVRVDNVGLTEGSLRDDLDIAVPGLGKLEVQFEGLEPSDWKRFSTSVYPLADKKGRRNLKKEIDGEDGVIRCSADLMRGSWIVEFRTRDMGSFERVVEIKPGETGKLSVDRGMLH